MRDILPQAFADTMSATDLSGLNRFTRDLPELTSCPKRTLETICSHLLKNGFSYKEGVATLNQVIDARAGSCLGLSVLVTGILISMGRSPNCKILVHPYDAVDKADKKLFADLMNGEYFDYENPVLPTLSDQASIDARINRFTSLTHPIVVLDGIPLETTLLASPEVDPFVEFQAESATCYGPEILLSYLLSDRVKLLWSKRSTRKNHSIMILKKLYAMIEKSLEIHPENCDALTLLYHLAHECSDSCQMRSAAERLINLGITNSDMSFKLWTLTNELKYLDMTLDQFPEHIPAFLDRKVLLETDRAEARMNLAVALWCIAYSSTFDLKDFYRDSQMRKKIAELFPQHLM